MMSARAKIGFGLPCVLTGIGTVIVFATCRSPDRGRGVPTEHPVAPVASLDSDEERVGSRPEEEIPEPLRSEIGHDDQSSEDPDLQWMAGHGVHHIGSLTPEEASLIEDKLVRSIENRVEDLRSIPTKYPPHQRSEVTERLTNLVEDAYARAQFMDNDAYWLFDHESFLALMRAESTEFMRRLGKRRASMLGPILREGRLVVPIVYVQE